MLPSVLLLTAVCRRKPVRCEVQGWPSQLSKTAAGVEFPRSMAARSGSRARRRRSGVVSREAESSGGILRASAASRGGGEGEGGVELGGYRRRRFSGRRGGEGVRLGWKGVGVTVRWSTPLERDERRFFPKRRGSVFGASSPRMSSEGRFGLRSWAGRWGLFRISSAGRWTKTRPNKHPKVI